MPWWVGGTPNTLQQHIFLNFVHFSSRCSVIFLDVAIDKWGQTQVGEELDYPKKVVVPDCSNTN